MVATKYILLILMTLHKIHTYTEEILFPYFTHRNVSSYSLGMVTWQPDKVCDFGVKWCYSNRGIVFILYVNHSHFRCILTTKNFGKQPARKLLAAQHKCFPSSRENFFTVFVQWVWLCILAKNLKFSRCTSSRMKFTYKE